MELFFFAGMCTVVGILPGLFLSTHASELFSKRLPLKRLDVVYGKFEPISSTQRAAIEKTAATQASLTLALTQAEEKKALAAPVSPSKEEESPLDTQTREKLREASLAFEAAVREAVETGDKEYVRQVVSTQVLLADNAKALAAAAAEGEVSDEQRAMFEENLVLLNAKLEQVKASRKAEGGKGLRVLNKFLRDEAAVEAEKIVA